MHDENNRNRPHPGQAPTQQQQPAQNDQFGQISFRSPEAAQPAPPQPAAAPPSGAFEQEFSGSHSGFQTNASGFNAPQKSGSPEFDLSLKVRAVYGASAFFGAAIIGLFLGFLNSALQGADMLGELETVIEITLWFAAFVGLLGALKPQEFERIFENLRNKIGD